MIRVYIFVRFRNNYNIPSALMCSPGEDVLTIYFHTIISPDFNYNPQTDKVQVIMGNKDYGDWDWWQPCLDLKVER